MRNILPWIKAAQRKEFVEERCMSEWDDREISPRSERTLRSFSQEEVDHIVLLNNHLKALTEEAKEKVERIQRDIQERIGNGSKDYGDYNIEAHIYVNPTPEQEILDDDAPFCEAMAKCEAMEHTLFVDDDEYEGSIGRRWMEMWTKYHVTLCMAFAWFFDDQNVFPPSYMMRLTPDNFVIQIKIDI